MSEKSGSKILKNLVWDEQRSQAAIMLAQGYEKKKICQQIGIDDSTLWRWEKNAEFAEEVDRLTLMYGFASKQERLRIINQAARQFVKDGKWDVSGFTLLDLLKEARMQSEGIKLDILSMLTALTGQEQSAALSAPPGLVEPGRISGSFILPESSTEETE
jgi:transposase-like protein